MASRILTFFSCTCYLFLLSTITIIGFASFIVGSIGAGLFIPFTITSDNYRNTTCLIVDVDYDRCEDACFDVLWSVKYRIRNPTFGQQVFSTIIEKFDTLAEQSNNVALYTDRSNHTCYYDKREFVRVQWEEPTSPRPFFIMMIVGFSLTGVYVICIGIFYCYRLNKCIK